MSVMSQDEYQQVLVRAGMKPLGGTLSQIAHVDPGSGEPAGNTGWARDGLGLFIVDERERRDVDLDAMVLRDLLVFVITFNDASTRFAVGDRRLDVEGSDVSVLFAPAGERFHFASSIEQGLKAVTVLVDPASLEAYGLPAAALPKSLCRMMQGGEMAFDALAPGEAGMVAAEAAARRGMFPSLARQYYSSKALELVSALLSQAARRDAMRSGDGAFDPKLLARLSLVKQALEEAPGHGLDVDALARIAGMNRTKLRASFKQAFGMTLSECRTGQLLRRADRALKQTGCTVQEAAHLAGYANPSAFIVAYKRRYGVRPGDVLPS